MRQSLVRAGQLALALLLAGLAVFLGLALISFQQTDPSFSTAAGPVVRNWMGWPGAFAADLLLSAFGLASVLLLPLPYVGARKLWRDADRDADPDAYVYAGAGAGADRLPGSASLSASLSGSRNGSRNGSRGGWWRAIGRLVLAMALLGSVLALVSDPRAWQLPAGWGGLAGLLGEGGLRALAGLLPQAARFWAILAGGLAALVAGALLAGRVYAIDWHHLLTLPLAIPGLFRGRRRPAVLLREAGIGPVGDDEGEDDGARAARRHSSARPALAQDPGQTRRPPEITEPGGGPGRALPAARPAQKDLFAQYELPGHDLLTDPPADTRPKLDRLALERNARLLETVLDDFNVKGEITAVRMGPVVTMYELEPAPGIKASRVIGLAEDIARNMSAISARVASIPGKTVMGIELPNAHRQIVSFKDMVSSETFVGHKGALPIILGKDIAGEPIVADLAAMPHLLVAGTTGSGKSVGLNCILLSLLFRFGPDQCRLILIDPKVLELKSYDRIPHLLAEVVTDPAKSVRALKWAVEEMERRYRMMSEIGARNLSGFNERVKAALAKGKPLRRSVQTGFDPDTGEPIIEEEALDYAVLPQIVLIVDELADLMVTVGKEIEVLIQRLSQKSRAAGIHLIMATQRPSVDVITGVIKANLPTRVSFAVTSRIDSRTILGEQGAEQLLGKGDMLYKPSTGALIRVHGPFVSDEEVERVADHWRAQGEPSYVGSVTEEPDEDSGYGYDDDLTGSDNPEERKYRQACQIVIENQKASGSWLQRQMGVGYNTAAKWIERMEEDGLVGPANHVGRREIYRDKDGNVL